MKKRAPVPKPLWDDLYPLLIARFRKIMKLPVGPSDKLLTREFRSLVENVLSYRASQKIETSEHLAAYLMYEWPLHYAEGLSLLQELPCKPEKVLDFGTKGAPFSLAALQHGAIDLLALGKEERTLRSGADICGHLGYPLSIETVDFSSFHSLKIKKPWDLIIVGHVLLQEFPAFEKQLSLIQNLLSLLSPQGHLLLVEDSALDINRSFLKLRDELNRRNISIAAPCLWKGACPALEHGSSPCFAQRPLDKPFMIKEIQRAAKINLSSLKMSYLLLRSPEAIAPTLPNNAYRVVSPPLRTYRGDRYFLCGTSGKKTLGTTLQEHPTHARAFEYLKRGDVISISDAVELEEDMQIIQKTKVTLLAPCDKPFPAQ